MRKEEIIHKWFLLFFLFSFLSGWSQDRKVDSLKAIVANQKEDTNRVNSVINLSAELYYKGYFLTSDSLAHSALTLSKKLNFKTGLMAAYNLLGLNNIDRGFYTNALKNLLEELNIAKEVNNKKVMALAYGNIGIIYYSEKNYSEALNSQLQSLKLQEEVGNKNGIANCYGNIGSIYNSQGNYTKALECYEKSLALHKEVNNKRGMSNNIGNMGNIYEAEKNYAKALECYEQSIDIAKANGLYSNIGIYIGAKGQVFTKLGRYKEAHKCLDSSLAILKQVGAKSDIGDEYAYLATLDSAEGNYKGEIENYKKYIAYRDSLTNEATTKAQMNLEYEQKQAVQKAEQEKREALAAAENRKQILIRNLFVAGFALMLLAVFFIYRSYRQKQKATALIVKQKEEVERLSIVARETDNLILIMDADGTVEWANESFARLNGITIEELKKKKGNTIYEISNNPNIRNIIDTAVKEHRSVVYESLNQNKQGEKLWESTTLTPIFANGKLHKLIIVDTDITQRKLDEETIQQKNKDITDSIQYAKRLQDAILPPISQVEKVFPDSFILYKPKDIVAGDFYWMERDGDTVLIAACDCTGHGVPGALVSVVCSNALNRALNEYNIRESGKMLDKVRELVLQTFERSENKVQDGMDISFCAINLKDKKMEWSGANNPLWQIRNGELKELPADKQPIGVQVNAKPFTTNSMDIQKGDVIYLFTDGYADQFGGPKGKKFKYNRLQELIMDNVQLSMREQKEILDKAFESWKGKYEQTDDVCIIGIRI